MTNLLYPAQLSGPQSQKTITADALIYFVCVCVCKREGYYHVLNSRSSACECWTWEEHASLAVTAKPLNAICGKLNLTDGKIDVKHLVYFLLKGLSVGLHAAAAAAAAACLFP